MVSGHGIKIEAEKVQLTLRLISLSSTKRKELAFSAGPWERGDPHLSRGGEGDDCRAKCCGLPDLDAEASLGAVRGLLGMASGVGVSSRSEPESFGRLSADEIFLAVGNFASGADLLFEGCNSLLFLAGNPPLDFDSSHLWSATVRVLASFRGPILRESVDEVLKRTENLRTSTYGCEM